MSLGIIIVGALGRMGREIAALTVADEQLSLAGALEYKGHPDTGKDYGLLLGKGSLQVNVVTSLDEVAIGGASVIIDFSSPKSLPVILPAAAEKRIPVVVGTTGLTQEDKKFAESFSSKIPLIVSPNMSLGVNLLFLLTKMVSERLKDDYDIEIIEAHHRFKKDSPSGTAKRLGEIVAESIGLPYEECVKDGREGICSTDRSRTEVGMHAVRGGDIVGDHTVLFAGIGERIELRHMAHSRTTFARGSLHAAKWLADKKPGYYSMRDMLGL